MKNNTAMRGTLGLAVLCLLAMLPAAWLAVAQAPAGRFMGTVTAINGDTLTVKTQQGEVNQVDVPATAAVKRIEPGQTNLASAVDMKFDELAVGDHVLVNLDPASTGAPPLALRVVAIKAEDVAKKNQQLIEEWQRGVGGLVKSVDAANSAITITSGPGTVAKTITVHTTSKTILKRYAPGSVRFEEATAAPLSTIQPGDQLRARGQKNTDGTEIAADEVVSGGFRNISGIVTSIDTSGSTLVVKDLATKKQVTVHLSPEVQMRRISDRAAQFLAARLKGEAPAGARAGGGAGAGAGAGAAGGSGPMTQRGGGGGMDLQQMLSRAPEIKLSDLQKGEAVMLVSTQGTSDLTAITLLAGVAPLLEAPASQDLLSSWSMSSSAPETAQ